MENSIIELLAAPWKANVVFTAVRLRVFTLLSNKLMTAEELSLTCGARPHILKPLLDACVSMGLIQSKKNMYINSEFSLDFLTEGGPHYVGDLINLQFDEIDQWEKLYNVALNVKKSEKKESSDKDRHRTFIKAMHNLGMLGEAQALRDSVDLAGCKQMIDAGGGSGIYSIVLCQKFPELRSKILDKKITLDVTREILSGYNEKNRITLLEADITKQSFGNNIDVVLLSDVIYDESESDMVLRNAKNCLRDNGTLILRGYYSDPENTKTLFGALFVLNQLIFDPGRKIMTFSSLQSKVKEIGFKILKVSPLTERSFILVAEK